MRGPAHGPATARLLALSLESPESGLIEAGQWVNLEVGGHCQETSTSPCRLVVLSSMNAASSDPAGMLSNFFDTSFSALVRQSMLRDHDGALAPTPVIGWRCRIWETPLNYAPDDRMPFCA